MLGIAEEHGILCAGLATMGLSSGLRHLLHLLQRALRSQSCTMLSAKSAPSSSAWIAAALSGDEGPTHHGLFDISYLRGIPNIIHMGGGFPKMRMSCRHHVYGPCSSLGQQRLTLSARLQDREPP